MDMISTTFMIVYRVIYATRQMRPSEWLLYVQAATPFYKGVPMRKCVTIYPNAEENNWYITVPDTKRVLLKYALLNIILQVSLLGFSFSLIYND